jgi:hypothetical protein
MGSLVKDKMDLALERACEDGALVAETEHEPDDVARSVVRIKGRHAVILRKRGPRVFDAIPPSELQLAARKLVASKGFAPGSDTHLRAVMDAFDLKRLTLHVQKSLEEILERKFPYVDEIIG